MDWAIDILSSRELWVGLGVMSALMFVGTLLAIPWLVARLPVDHFLEARRVEQPQSRHPVVAFVRRLARNTLGIGLVLAGIAMLVLPGQGILTILLGVALIDFPGKHRFEERLLRQRHVRRSLQWLRKRAGRDPLDFEDASTAAMTCVPGSGEGAREQESEASR